MAAKKTATKKKAVPAVKHAYILVLDRDNLATIDDEPHNYADADTLRHLLSRDEVISEIQQVVDDDGNTTSTKFHVYKVEVVPVTLTESKASIKLG